MTISVVVPEQFAPTWLYEVDPEGVGVELYVPDDGDAPQLSFGTRSPQRFWLARRLRSVLWPLPHMVAGEHLGQLLADLVPDAELVMRGLRTTRSPRGTEQVLTSRARAAVERIRKRLERAVAERAVVEPRGWSPELAVAVDQEVSAETTDEQLAEVAERIRSALVPARAGDYVFVPQLAKEVERARLRARQQVRDYLAILGGLTQADRSRRDALLRRIKAWCDPVDTDRALGAAVGMTHGAVQQIIKKTAATDTAVDSLGATLRSLALAWAPDPVPDLDDAGPRDDFDDEHQDEEYDEPYGALPPWQLRRAHEAKRICAACQAASATHIVRRWQIARTLFPATPGDPTAENTYVNGLSEPPSYEGQPTWTVCGTICARQVIDTDRANPTGPSWVPDAAFHYQLESWRYEPLEADLPVPVRTLRSVLRGTSYRLEDLNRALGASDPYRAANTITDLRRHIVQAATALADLEIVTALSYRYQVGEPEPTWPRVLWVRHAGRLYRSQNQYTLTGTTRLWVTAESNTAYTWAELAELAGDQGLEVIPRPYLVLDQPQHENEDDYDDYEDYEDYDW